LRNVRFAFRLLVGWRDLLKCVLEDPVDHCLLLVDILLRESERVGGGGGAERERVGGRELYIVNLLVQVHCIIEMI